MSAYCYKKAIPKAVWPRPNFHKEYTFSSVVKFVRAAWCVGRLLIALLRLLCWFGISFNHANTNIKASNPETHGRYVVITWGLDPSQINEIIMNCARSGKFEDTTQVFKRIQKRSHCKKSWWERLDGRILNGKRLLRLAEVSRQLQWRINLI